MKGTAIITALIFIVIGSLIVGGYLWYISREIWITKRTNDSIKALYIAEAGLERKLYEIKNANYDDITTPVYFPDTSDPESYYTVDVEKYGDVYKITSTGVYHSGIRKIRQSARMFSLWDLAFFSGEATSGYLAGCMNTRGTIFVLGEESFIDVNESGVFESGIDIDDNNDGILSHLSPSDYAIDATGNFYIGNNYDPYLASSGIPETFSSRVPSIYDPDLGYDTLNAKLYVKYGKVSLGGSSQIGNEDQINGPMTQINVPDGFNPPSAAEPGPDQKIFYVEDGLLSDRGMFSEKIRFPNLLDRYTDPATGTVYEYIPPDYNNNIVGGRMKYLQENGLRLTTRGTPGYLPIPEDLTPDPSKNFSYTDGVNSFSLTNGHISINGIVYIDGNLTLDRYRGDRTITYEGKGSIVLTGNLTINVNFYPRETGVGVFPERHIIGFMTPKNIALGVSGTGRNEIMGVFYAGGTGNIVKPSKVAGGFIAHQIILTQVPDIFQVKNIKDNLPRGMINIPTVLVIYGWHEVFEE